MNTKRFYLLLFLSFITLTSVAQDVGKQWSKEKAVAWQRDNPWYVGFNYIPAYAINYTAMWDKTSFDPAVIDKELALAKKLGMNSLRAVLQYAVYEDDPAYFLETLDTFMEVCKKNDIKFMPALFDDCVFGITFEPKIGKQPEPLKGWYAWAWSPSPGASMVADHNQHPKLEKYVRDVIGKFKNDDRILLWDLYNEPTNGGMGTTSLPLVNKVFKWAREINPSQPISIGIWNGNEKLNDVLLANSDIITFHYYGDKAGLTKYIEKLKTYGRPLINTEWLNRSMGSDVTTDIPVFYEENVGCMLWGLVNGKTQTHLPWGHRPGDPDAKVWQHDLYHGDFTPYDPKELEAIKTYAAKSKPKN